MQQKSAKRQQQYRDRQFALGARRLDIFISSSAHQAITRISAVSGASQREVIEGLALSSGQTIISQDQTLAKNWRP